MKKKTLGEKAYEELKNKVAHMESGAHLSVRNFSKETGIGYTPVREAFLRMEREGTLKQIPNVGFFVQTYDVTSIIHYYQVRECIEPYVLKQVFHQITQEDISQMQHHLDKADSALEKKDYAGFINHDIAFHEVMFSRYGNPYFLNLYESIRTQNMYFSRENREISSFASKDHRVLLDAICSGDEEQSLNVLVNHIKTARIKVLAGFVQYLSAAKSTSE